MLYEGDAVRRAFEIFQALTRTGKANQSDYQLYLADDQIRGLLNEFVAFVDCDVVTVGQQLLLIPTVGNSPHHVSNEYLRTTYLKAGGTNKELYLMYFTSLVLFGEFYNSYLSHEPTRNFMPLTEWVTAVQQRIDTLKEHSEEALQKFAVEFEYNWPSIIDKWDSMDDLKEGAQRQSGKTISRLSFIDMTRNFLVEEGLIEDIGNYEVTLTEKAKTIIQRYFMDLDYNRGILEFLYETEAEGKEGESDGDHFKN